MAATYQYDGSFSERKTALTTRVLKAPRRQHRIQEQALADRVNRQPSLGAIRQRPKRRDDNHLRALRNHLPKSLRERQIPAYQHPDFAQGRVEDWVRVVGARRQVQPLDVAPEVLLHVLACDLAGGRDEVGDIEEALVWGAFVVEFDERAGDDVDGAFLG